ncbi:MAG: LysR family transcriptional regulator [Bacteroidales bacterium]|nr:LysR family transcriptional regulator [Bacteroidales bacterium]
MTLQQLKYIVALDQWGHFGKAAEACDLTQSTLSLMIKKLEEELDVLIFDREAHPVTPTEIGRRIIDQAKVVLYNVSQITEMTRSEKENISGPINIAMISTVAPVLVPGLFNFIKNNYPSISLQTEEMLSETIKDKIRKTEVDVGILTAPFNDPELLEIPVYTEHFYAYVSKNDPAYALDSISLDNLRGRSIWIMKNGVRLYDMSSVKEFKAGSYERFFEGGRVGILIQIVNDNGGLTIIPESHIKFIDPSLQSCIKPIIEPAPKRTIALAIRKDYVHEAMLNVVLRALKTIVPARLKESAVKKEWLKL